MQWHITLKEGQIIASFEHEGDRDMCLDALEEAYPDCKFDTKDDEE